MSCATLPPLPSRTRPHTSPGSRSSSNSTFLTSPVDSKHPPKRRLARKNRVHPDSTLNSRLPNRPPPNSIPTSPTHSTALKSTSSSNASHTRLSSANSLNSTFFGPLLTTDLRKGGRRPSVNTSWVFDGQRQLESCFLDGHAKVFVATWNMHEEKVCVDMRYSLVPKLLPCKKKDEEGPGYEARQIPHSQAPSRLSITCFKSGGGAWEQGYSCSLSVYLNYRIFPLVWMTFSFPLHMSRQQTCTS